MSANNNTRIQFKIDWRNKEIEARSFLIIQYGTYEDEALEKELELTHGEDLKSYIESIVNKRYDEIFEDYEMTDGICYVQFIGIRVSAQNEKGSMFYQLKNGQKYAHITVSNTVLQDIHKEKMDKILEIIKE